MKRKGANTLISEIRFRVSRNDLQRIDWLIQQHEMAVSSLLRLLISQEVDRLKTQSGILNDLIGE